MAIKMTDEEKARLMAVKRELAARIGELRADRDAILAGIGVRPTTYEAAYTRGSIKLSWILRLLRELDIPAGEFFAKAFGYEGRPEPCGTPPNGVKTLHKREARGDFDAHG